MAFAGSGAAANRPAHHQIISAPLGCITRCGNLRLIILAAALLRLVRIYRPNTGNQDRHFAAECFPQRLNVFACGDDSVHPCSLCHRRQRGHPSADRSCQSYPNQFGLVQTRQDGNPKEHWWPLGTLHRRPGGTQHCQSARRMDAHHPDARQPRSGLHRACHGVGDIAELQVKEYAGNQLRDSTDCLRSFSREQLAADFDEANSAANPADESNRLIYVWEVQCYDQFTGCVAFDGGTLSSSTLTRAVPRCTKPNSLATW